MLKSFETGPLGANCYVLSCNKTKQAVIIDPGGPSDELNRHIDTHKLKPVFIILTHGHLDHIGGCGALVKKHGIPVYVHAGDRDMVMHPKKYVPFMGVLIPDIPHPEKTLEDGDTLKAGEMALKIIHTPGHTEGGISVYVKEEGAVFTGDTLFFEGVGRTDLAGGSIEKLVTSIKDKLFKLDDATAVYPGHGPESSIGYEKKHNPFMGVKEV